MEPLVTDQASTLIEEVLGNFAVPFPSPVIKGGVPAAKISPHRRAGPANEADVQECVLCFPTLTLAARLELTEDHWEAAALIPEMLEAVQHITPWSHFAGFGCLCGSHRRDFQELSCLPQALQGAIVSSWSKALLSDLLHPDPGKIPTNACGCAPSH